MDKDQFDQATSSGPQATDGQALNARRRLLKGGLGLAPVAMTMASRPVLAGTETCHGPTGFQSAPPSRVGQTPSCNIGKGKGPTALSSEADGSYPQQCAKTTFSAAFGVNTLFPSLTISRAIRNQFVAYDSKGQIVWDYRSVSDQHKLMAREVAAAYYNALDGKGFPMTPIQVRELWQGYVGNSYKPGGFGNPWNYGQFTKYLDYIMTA